ncbi:DNA-damage-inducible protein J [Nitrosospira multiformis]|uniref:DNA-damage-inducible protein J n=1 Tax=Nitrosospira multiformis TaxID=1231 RepID=A0A1I7GR57_9PROT|nr:DNA-damage-inducible protein J [Nitrosospira multiformis]
MAKTEIVRARIDAQVKEEASRILEQMALPLRMEYACF